MKIFFSLALLYSVNSYSANLDARNSIKLFLDDVSGSMTGSKDITQTRIDFKIIDENIDQKSKAGCVGPINAISSYSKEHSMNEGEIDHLNLFCKLNLSSNYINPLRTFVALKNIKADNYNFFVNLGAKINEDIQKKLDEVKSLPLTYKIESVDTQIASKKGVILSNVKVTFFPELEESNILVDYLLVKYKNEDRFFIRDMQLLGSQGEKNLSVLKLHLKSVNNIFKAIKKKELSVIDHKDFFKYYDKNKLNVLLDNMDSLL